MPIDGPRNLQKEYTKEAKVLFIQAVPRFGGALKSLFLFMKITNFTPILATSKEGKLTELCEKEGIKYHVLPMPMWRKLKSWSKIPFSIAKLVKIVRDEEIDAIYANTLWDIPYAVVTGKITGKKVAGHIRNTFTKDKIGKYFLFLTDVIATVSFAVSKPLWDTGIPWRVIYNGVPDGEKMFGKKDRRFKIALVGRVDSTKGQDMAIKALALASEKVNHLQLSIAGEESYLEKGLIKKLQKLSEKLNVADKIRFLGHVDNVYKLFGESDVSVVPSKPTSNEGFGRIIPEAMINFTPVIATKVGGIPEVLRDKITGFLVEPHEKDFCEKLLKYFSYPVLRKKHGANGQKLTRKKFLLTHNSKKIEGLLCNLIN